MTRSMLLQLRSAPPGSSGSTRDIAESPKRYQNESARVDMRALHRIGRREGSTGMCGVGAEVSKGYESMCKSNGIMIR